jgi:hypothetical protein
MAPLTVAVPSVLMHLHNNFRRQTESSPKNVTDSAGLSTGAKFGIAIAVIIPVITLGLVFFYLYTHNWAIPKRIRFSIPRSKIDLRSLIKWRRKSFQRMDSVQNISPNVSHADFDDDSTKVGVETPPKPTPSRWWSANEIGKNGEKAKTGRSRFSVVAPPPEEHKPKVVKAPRPSSIFTSKTSIYGAERDKGEPDVVRPSSRQVKTWSRHISTQFLDFGRPALSSPTSPKEDGIVEDSVEHVENQNRRDSKAVVTNLNWQEYDMPSR